MNTQAGDLQVSVPSWVIPGTYLENLHFLADKPVTGVELLFFIYNDEIAGMLDAEFTGIRDYSDRFRFTAHLPDDLSPEHETLVEKLAPLVRHFIVHPATDKKPGSQEAQAQMLNTWASKYGIASQPRFLMENTCPGLLEGMLPLLDEKIGICMDTGHLLEQEQSPSAFMTRYADRTGEIHLHGLDRDSAAVDGRLPDHRALRATDPWLHELFPLLRTFAGVINLEVFSWDEAEQGVQVLQHLSTASK